MKTQISKLNTETPRTQRFTEKRFPILLRESLCSPCLCVKLALIIFLTCTISHAATTNDITSLVQRGLFEEEANHNLDAATQSYETAIKLHDKDRKLAATAVFRLGECYRKQGKTNEANNQYKRILTEFPDQKELADLSRTYLPKDATNKVHAQPEKSVTNATRPDLWDLNNLSLETAKAESVWAHVSKLGGEDLVKFFITIQPDQLMIDADRERSEAITKLDELSTRLGSDHPEYKAQQNIVKLKTERAYERAHTLAWSVEQRYKMLKDQEDALKTHLNQGSNPFAKTTETATTSEEDEEIRKIKEMIQNSPDLINARNQAGVTPLESAASSGHLKVAEYLVASGAEVNPHGTTPLMIASENGHNAVVEFLLSKGANVDAQNNIGFSALHCAAQHGYKIVIETLLKHHAKVNAGDRDGVTPLWYAADAGFKPIVELLLANGGDVNAKGRHSSPLLQAVLKKHSDCVDLLATHKADVNFMDSDGYTPLLVAARNDDSISAEILLDHGADTESQIPIQYMGSDRGYVRNWQFASYRPIIFALTKDDPKLVEALLQHHADPNSKFTLYDNGNPLIQGATPLITAVRLNEPAIVEMLLTHEADVNRPDETGATPLHYATKFSNTNLAEILLRHDANSNAFDKNHQTPLFYAITFGMHDTNMVALLINHHADVNIANNNGYPPIYHVMGNPPETPLGAIREQLLKAGANENFVRLKQISIRRNNHETVIFTKGSNDWNHFTLFELISVVYGRNEAPNQRSQPGFAPGLRTIPTMPVYSPGNPLAAPVPGMIGGMSQTDNFQFPDLAQIIIRRISPVALTQLNRVPITALPGTQRDEKRYQVDLDNRFQSSDRGNDIPLEWGDIIEIPELDHPVNARWEGISSQTQHRLIGLLSSPIQIKIKTASTNLSVLPPMPNFPNTDMWRLYVRSAPNQTAAPNTIVSPFGLRAIVSAVGVLRSSSDTTHVKIVRHTDSNVRSITVNLQEGEELWIEPGDVIEIPDRGTDAASQPNQPPE